MATINGDISRLPESCVAHTLSLTSPPDSCRSAAVSTTFRCAAESDTVWDRFLPPDHLEILSQAVQPPTFSSKKELYFRLCDPILINGGKMCFALERSSGKKCFMISAKELVIVWGDTPRYWGWIPSSDSRFSEVAMLLGVCWLEIRGKIDTRVLSPKTTYCARLVYKIAEESYGLSFPAEASVKVGTYVSERRVYLTHDERSNAYPQYPGMVIGGPNLRARPQLGLQGRGYNNMTGDQVSNGTEQLPHAREDGWVKLDMGEFFIDEGDDSEVNISLMEVNGGHWKRGLIVQGIEVRPKK